MKITVVTPAYNRYKDLEKLIKSFLKQDYENSELLIIDDLGSPKIGEVSRKWMKKSKKILYKKNNKNLGVVANIRNSFEIAKGDVVLFMGDDDIFINNSALSFVADAFKRGSVYVAKASQILFKDGKVSQSFPLKNDEEIIYYRGKDIYEKIWFETISFTGLAFRNNSRMRSLISDSKTLFPQVELAGISSLFFEFAEINRHLVGVQSYSSGQLNPVFYYIEGKRTNILEDWKQIYKKITKVAKIEKAPFISQTRFAQKLTYFSLFLLPYNTLTNGRLETLKFILGILKFNKKILISVFFWISTIVSVVFPRPLIVVLLESIKKVRLNKVLQKEQINKYNLLLKKYY